MPPTDAIEAADERDPQRAGDRLSQVGEQAPGGGWKNEGFPDEAIAAVRQVDNCRELSH